MTAAGPTELTEQELGKLIEWQKKIHSIPSHVERGGQGRDRVADVLHPTKEGQFPRDPIFFGKIPIF